MTFTVKDVLLAFKDAEYKPYRSDEWTRVFVSENDENYDEDYDVKRVDWDDNGEGLDWYEVDGWRVFLDGEWHIVEEVDSTGGMDEGSHATKTFKVAGRYFRKSGFYASHDGYYWDGDFEEVEPFERTITDYRPI